MNDAARPERDLVILVADKNMEFSISGVLTRFESLDIRPIDYVIFTHPERDPACLHKAGAFLATHRNRCAHALVVFDREGCGRDEDRTTLERTVEQRLAASGWGDRAAAVVINPELENWVWSDSPEVDRVLGWAGQLQPVRTWLREQGFLAGTGKPERPKEAMEAALRVARKPRSSALFGELSRRVSLARCADPAFLKLRAVLSGWFPRSGSPRT